MSAFSTFSGSSKKTRNVNLSGQRNVNPFSANKWSPASSGASATVAQAQAEREKRHRERQELNAARLLQRVWKGHKAREQTKELCRGHFDTLYHTSSLERVHSALPLLLVLFDPTNHQDQQRLDLFVQDCTSSADAGSAFLNISSPRLQNKLTLVLVKALERYSSFPSVS